MESLCGGAVLCFLAAPVRVCSVQKLTTWFYLLLGFSWFIRLLSGLSLVIWDASVLPAAVGPGFGYASWTHLDNFALGALFCR